MKYGTRSQSPIYLWEHFHFESIIISTAAIRGHQGQSATRIHFNRSPSVQGLDWCMLGVISNNQTADAL